MSGRLGWNAFNPLIPKCNKVLISPYKYHPWLKGLSHENMGNNQQLTKLLMILQILPVRILEMYREQYGEYAYWC